MVPTVGSIWEHKNGVHYEVMAIANKATTRPDEYPVTVVYENIRNGLIWCRPLDRWQGSFTKIR